MSVRTNIRRINVVCRVDCLNRYCFEQSFYGKMPFGTTPSRRKVAAPNVRP